MKIYFEILGKPIEEYRRLLGSFGVSGDLALQNIASLSGGQKSRVAFAVLGTARPNFLILDEPTNHLDIETIEALGKALGKYQVSETLLYEKRRDRETSVCVNNDNCAIGF
jgi:ATP-binding cassette subfamily F protein 3